MIHFGEALFSVLWLIGLIIVAKTGATAIRLGVYLGATLFAFLWDWIQGQAWLFRITFDDRLIPAFTLDGREEPLFAPLAYGLVFGTASVVGLALYPYLHRKFGAWTYLLVGLVVGVLDILIEGGVAVTLLDMYVFDYDSRWKILNLPWATVLYVAIMAAALLFAVVSLDHLIRAARANSEELECKRDPAGVWWICLLLPAGVNYFAVGVVALIFNSFAPW
jgi:hypothetical protein